MFSWQDARTGQEVEDLRQIVSAEQYYEQNGLPLGTTWIVTKILWMRKHEPDLLARTARFVQNQDLVLRAFGADEFYTDLCCAVFYGVWDVRRANWNMPLLERLNLSPEMFGRPTPPGTQVGTISPAVADKTGFAAGTPLCVGAGDQNCSVLGMGATEPGLATVTLGTAGLAILATRRPLAGFGGMMITHHAVPGMWEVEGLSNAAAASLRWYRDVVGTSEKQLEAAGGRDAYAQLDDWLPPLLRAAEVCCTCPTWRPPPRPAGTRRPELPSSDSPSPTAARR